MRRHGQAYACQRPVAVQAAGGESGDPDAPKPAVRTLSVSRNSCIHMARRFGSTSQPRRV